MGNFLSKEGVYYFYTDPACPYAVTEGSDGFRAQYDYNGNMVAKNDPLGDEFVYSYDEENQLIKAVKNGTHTEEFIYDVSGMRVRKTTGGAVTDYFYDGVNLLYEVTGGIGKNHIWANGTHFLILSPSMTTAPLVPPGDSWPGHPRFGSRPPGLSVRRRRP